MNSDSYASFRAAGALGDLDPDEPRRTPNLVRYDCGAFLSPGKFIVQTFEETPGEDDPEFGYIPGRPAGEVFTWPCKRCGKGRREEYYA